MSDEDKLAEFESLCAEYRRALQKVPHSRGDHTDRCRMENAGQAPADPKDCCCHVGLVCSTLKAGSKLGEKK
jgi:hypothetical protein